MAQPARTRASHLPSPSRRRRGRDRRRAIRFLPRLPSLSQGLQDVPPSRRSLRHHLQRKRDQLLPHRRRHPRLQQDQHSATYSSALPPRLGHGVLQCLARRQNRRALPAHRPPAVRVTRSIHPSSRDDRNRAPLRRHDADAGKLLHVLCRDAGVDLQHARAAAVETRRVTRTHQLSVQHDEYLRVVHVHEQFGT